MDEYIALGADEEVVDDAHPAFARREAGFKRTFTIMAMETVNQNTSPRKLLRSWLLTLVSPVGWVAALVSVAALCVKPTCETRLQLWLIMDALLMVFLAPIYQAAIMLASHNGNRCCFKALWHMTAVVLIIIPAAMVITGINVWLGSTDAMCHACEGSDDWRCRLNPRIVVFCVLILPLLVFGVLALPIMLFGCISSEGKVSIESTYSVSPST